MNTSPAKLPEFEHQILTDMQFHLMQLALSERDLEMLLVDLEGLYNKFHDLKSAECAEIDRLFEEFKVHLQSKDRFVNALKLQKTIASRQNHPHLTELEQLLDQVQRHLDHKNYQYFTGCFQIALINPDKNGKKELERILENIKNHEDKHYYINQLHRELTQYYNRLSS
jgi:hemolysin activation/secretion protein